MIKVENSIVINRPLSEVFAFICDPANQAKWQDGLVRARLSSGDTLAVGAEITETRKFMGREMDSRIQITQFEPNKLFAGKVIDGPVPFEINQTFEAVAGGTQASIRLQAEPGGFFKLAEGMVQKQLQTQIVADSERVKKLLEG